jgi:hypothetical protein
MLLKYYKIFKSLNPKIKIGAIFTYAANDSQDDELTGTNQGFANEKVTSDELQAIMDDYNQMFGMQNIENHLNLITKPDLRLPPRGMLKFARLEIMLSEFVEDDLLINGVIGADGAMPKAFRIEAGKNTLRSFVAKVLRADPDNMELLTNEFFIDFVKEVE